MKAKRNRLKSHDRTKNLCFSLYPTTAKSLRSLCDEWGSVGRAIQVAVEILVDRRHDGKKLEGFGLSSDEERREDLKVPFSFSVPDRTEKQIEWLSNAEHYGNRNKVISVCEGLLSDLDVRSGRHNK